MKAISKFLFATSLLSLLFAACQNNNVNSSSKENDSLKTVIALLDSNMNDILSSFEAVSANLEEISSKQQSIYYSVGNKTELKQNSKDKINENIKDINDLMMMNKKILDDLGAKFKTKDTSNKHFSKTFSILTGTLGQKSSELEQLNTKLAAIDAKMAQLKSQLFEYAVTNDVYSEVLEDNEKEMNTGFYTVGTFKDLEKAQLIDRKGGGILGNKKTEKLSANFDDNKFVKINISKNTIIPVNGKRCEIITSHPSDSYHFEYSASDKKFATNLVITDVKKFWKASKYLVVGHD